MNGKVSFHPIDNIFSFTSSTVFTTCGEIPIPANSFFVLTALAINVNSKPKAIIITKGSSTITQVSADNDVISNLSGTASGYTQKNTTIAFYAKYTSANENQMSIQGFYITVKEDIANE